MTVQRLHVQMFELTAITMLILPVCAQLGANASTSGRNQFFGAPSLGGRTNSWILGNGNGTLSDLAATTLEGGKIDIAKQSGWKVIYFWSAECPCVKACEEYTLKPLAVKYAGKVTFYAVDAGAYDLNKPATELQKEGERMTCRIRSYSTEPMPSRRRSTRR